MEGWTLERMKFKNFTWPNNPEQYAEEWVRPVKYEKTDTGATVYAGLGSPCRKATGRGVFQGQGAYNQFKALLALLKENTPGDLVHPVWGTGQVYLTELTLQQEPLEDYVAYTFVFRGADSQGNIPKM